VRTGEVTATARGRGRAEACVPIAGGYKVWLGSIETDGTRLVSDGADNKSECV